TLATTTMIALISAWQSRRPPDARRSVPDAPTVRSFPCRDWADCIIDTISRPEEPALRSLNFSVPTAGELRPICRRRTSPVSCQPSIGAVTQPICPPSLRARGPLQLRLDTYFFWLRRYSESELLSVRSNRVLKWASPRTPGANPSP